MHAHAKILASVNGNFSPGKKGCSPSPPVCLSSRNTARGRISSSLLQQKYQFALHTAWDFVLEAHVQFLLENSDRLQYIIPGLYHWSYLPEVSRLPSAYYE
ncbi:hypothetical protein AA313_de0208914 [Arthrobotrys entomopaga]|nr:hypothetical protein AA313_de0208914 [Arthrobotrys entomopaga]